MDDVLDPDDRHPVGVDRARSCRRARGPRASVSPPAISSSSSTRGRVASARASSRRLRCEQRELAGAHVGPVEHAGALERVDGGVDGVVAAPPAPAVGRADEDVLEHRQPSNGRGTCAVRPMPSRQRRWAASGVTSVAVEAHRPRGRARGRRRSRFSVVVLPAPLGPTIPSASPGASEKLEVVDDARGRRSAWTIPATSMIGAGQLRASSRGDRLHRAAGRDVGVAGVVDDDRGR